MQNYFWSIILCSLFVLTMMSLPANANANANAKEKPIKVVTTFTIIADMARNVAGDKMIIVSITKPGAEIHGYEPTPQDIVKALDADLILHNGLNLERWYKRFVQDLNDAQSVVLTDGIQPISIYEGPYAGKPNPHSWMSPSDALIYVENIKNAFSSIDPENADFYSQNAQIYSDKIKAIKTDLVARLAHIPEEKRWLVSSEGAFSYLARDLGFKEVYLWPINAEQQGTPQQVRHVIDMVKKHNIPVVFSETTISGKAAQQVAAETQAIYGGALYVDSLSQSSGPVPTYLDLLRKTTDIIAQGFETAIQTD